MESLDDDWQPAPENAHPNARRLLQPDFYWDVADEGSPFGNDTGWESAEAIPDDDLAGRLEEEHFDILTYDDAVIAVAFAQLVLAGNAEIDMAARALRALRRQAMPEVIAFRGWSDPEARALRCAQMQEVMQSST